jgi:MoxR-like ATPase
MMTLSMGYPSDVEEAQIITAQRSLVHPVENVKAVVSKKDILEAMEEAVEVHVDDAVLAYLIALAKASREDMRIAAGVSPRGSIALYKACQAYAAIHNRTYVVPDDVKTLVPFVFNKRIILKPNALMKGYTNEEVISRILEQEPVPNYSAK